MNTKYCKDCVKEIDAIATKCPHCRSPQAGISRILNSPVISIPLYLAVFLAVIWGGDYFSRTNDIYSPGGFEILNKNIQIASGDCGQKLEYLGEIFNSNGDSYEDFHFNLEAYDENGKLIVAFSHREYSLLVPSKSSIKFKIENKVNLIAGVPSKVIVSVVKATKI